jgi:hypothetical protein
MAHGGSGTYGNFAHLLLGFAFCTVLWRGGAFWMGYAMWELEQIAASGGGDA